MRITFELTEPEGFLKFLDRIEPSASRAIPVDVVTIADAIEARLTGERLQGMSEKAFRAASDAA
jgi:hypothetical protein